ncbi:MAG: 30S ribosomal protein S20 [Candidatus Absconditabacterales bacterium]|nr:30S ribosomal protein S20 [Candidatus Absconditabacterales bacterium]
MPVTKSAKKALAQSQKRRVVNDRYRKDLEVAISIFRKKVRKGESVSLDDVNKIYSLVDKAKAKNLLHRNTAARRKSRFMKMYQSTLTK